MAKVKGLLTIQRALKIHAGASERGVGLGLKKAGLFLQRESQKLVPIDTGVLRNTANTRALGTGYDTVVTVGYDTDYAVYVHEDMEARHKPGKSAKFLEAPFRDHSAKLASIVADTILYYTGR